MAARTTIVTACDKNYLWGVYLLVASLRRWGTTLPIHAHLEGFEGADRGLIEQFDGVRIFPLAASRDRSVALEKPTALLSAETENVAWIDADCIASGDVTQALVAEEGAIQIKVRTDEEIAWLFRQRYAAGEPRGTLPRKILDAWREDVGEKALPVLERPLVTDRFVVHRDDLGFIRRWQAQMARIIPRSGKGAYDDRCFAYFLLDESVLTSLLLYAHDAPRIMDFHLERDGGAGVIHWGGSPKPWQAWIPRTLADFELTLSTIEWALEKGYRTPEIPWHFDRRYARLCHPAAVCRETWQSAMLGAKDYLKTVLGFKRVRRGAATSSASFDEPRRALAREASSRRADPFEARRDRAPGA